ncbi:MAG: DUF4160 domain-containing protein [Bacteroidia bacterium]
MPRIYEYLGLIVFFWSNEHEPIHVHIEYGDYIAVVEFIIENGKVVSFEFKKKRSAPMLPDAQLKKAKELIEAKKDEILKKWIDYFILKKNIKPERITKRIK